MSPPRLWTRMALSSSLLPRTPTPQGPHHPTEEHPLPAATESDPLARRPQQARKRRAVLLQAHLRGDPMPPTRTDSTRDG